MIRGKVAGSLLSRSVVELILVGLIFAVFIFAISGRVDGRDVKQQVLEKELALLIDAAEVGFSFEVSHINVRGVVDDIRIEDGRVFADVDGFRSVRGYPYFSRYEVDVEEVTGKFVVRVLE